MLGGGSSNLRSLNLHGGPLGRPVNTAPAPVSLQKGADKSSHLRGPSEGLKGTPSTVPGTSRVAGSPAPVRPLHTLMVQAGWHSVLRFLA